MQFWIATHYEQVCTWSVKASYLHLWKDLCINCIDKKHHLPFFSHSLKSFSFFAVLMWGCVLQHFNFSLQICLDLTYSNLNVAGNSFTESCYFVAKSIIDWSTSIWVTTHIKRNLVYDDRQAKARILTSWNYLPFHSLRLLFSFTFFHLFTINFKLLLFKKLTAGVRELTYFFKFCNRFLRD